MQVRVMHGTGDMAALRARMRAIETSQTPFAQALSFGCAGADAVLGGALSRGRVHELGGTAATLFAAFALVRSEGPVLWCAHEGEPSALYPPGLAQAGLDPARLVLVRLWSRHDLQHAAHEGLRAGWHVVLEGIKPLGLAASRRLQLAAETGGGMGLVVAAGRTDEEVLMPSAVTRWGAFRCDGALWPKRLRVRLQLLRNRGGPLGQWIMEWDHASRTFSLVPSTRHRSCRAARAVVA